MSDELERIAAELAKVGVQPTHGRALRAETALRALLACLPHLTPESRLLVFQVLTADYCRHCGADDPGCQCWNDE